ncbi:MAG: complement resistance protein TraT [Acidiferrobacteraceae bacterium]
MGWVSVRRWFLASTAALVLGGCATGPAPTRTSESGLSASNMHLSARMSNSVFLQPVGPAERVVFIQGHNTSSARGLHLQQIIVHELLDKGYRLTDNPADAHYMLLYNIRYVGAETRRDTATGALIGGWGGAIYGASIGNGDETLGGGLIGLGVGALVGSMFQHRHYMMVVDVQLEERQQGTYTSLDTATSEGTATTLRAEHSGIRNWMIYRNRVVAEASGLNLHFGYAEPALTREVGQELGGIF